MFWVGVKGLALGVRVYNLGLGLEEWFVWDLELELGLEFLYVSTDYGSGEG